MSLSQVQSRLLEKRVVHIYGEIDEPTFDYMTNAMMHLTAQDCPDFELRISSPGGSVDIGLAVYDMIELYPGNVTGTVFGVAASMGAIILQACDVRRATKHSQILIHHISQPQDVTLDMLRDEAALKRVREGMEESQAELDMILSRRTGKTHHQIKKQCVKDFPFSATEALDFGLLDELFTEPTS